MWSGWGGERGEASSIIVTDLEVSAFSECFLFSISNCTLFLILTFFLIQTSFFFFFYYTMTREALIIVLVCYIDYGNQGFFEV